MRGKKKCWRWYHMSAGDTSVELEDLLVILPWMVEAILVSLFPLVAHGRPQLVSASHHPELGSGDRSLARLEQPRGCGCRFYRRFVSQVDEIWWLTWNAIRSNNRFLRTFSQRKYRGWSVTELEQTSTNHRQNTVASSVVWIAMITDGSFDVRVASCATGVKSPCTHHLKWSSGVKNFVDSQNMNLEGVYTYLCKNQPDVLATCATRKVHSIEIVPRMLERLISWIFGGWLQVYHFSFSEQDLFARWWSHIRNWVLSSDCILCNCTWLLSFAVMWIATVAGLSFSSKRFSCRTCILLWFYLCALGDVTIITRTSLLTTSFLEVCTK